MSTAPHLPDFTQAKILVIGDVMLDRYWHGNTERISPEAPVPVVHVKQQDERAGGAGNVAINLSALGCSTSLLSIIGNDEAGISLENVLAAEHIHCKLKKLPIPTSTKLRVLSQHQQLIRLDFEERQPDIDSATLLPEFKALLPQHTMLILSDYNKGVLKFAQEIIQEAKQHHIPILVDPKGHDFSIYRGATLLTPNRKEFELVVGPCHSEDELVKKGLKLIEDYDLQALLITRGAQGMTLLQRGEEAMHLPAQQHDVFDVTGAGDTVIATLAAALAGGYDLAQATHLANLAAGISVTKLGAATVSPRELAQALLEPHLVESAILDEKTLLSEIQAARLRGEKIVMTNGCFDILHAGHVRYLNQAKSLGDRLIVAVNSDASVRRLKGSERPINSLPHRMTVLSGLSSVDWVVSFSEDTPENLIQAILPDVLVKGGDYQFPETIPGAKAVIENGGEMKLLHFEENCSTSKIVERIRETDTNKI